jgi:hypothetical protein
VHVVEDEQNGLAGGERLEEAAQRPEELPRGGGTGGVSGQLRNVLADQLGVLVAGQERGDVRRDPLRNRLANRFGERQVRRALAVGDTAPDEDLCARGGNQLCREP